MLNSDSLKVIPDFLDNSADSFPEKVGLVFNEKEYSYKEIKERADAVCSLISKKTRKGDVVSLFLPNLPEMIFSYFGILKAGCIVVLHPANISDSALAFQVEKTKSKLIISHKKYKEKLERAGVLDKSEYINIEDLPLTGRAFPERDVRENDISTIIFTSGATAEPKGVKLRHQNVVSATKNIIEFLKWNKNDIDINASALSHSFGLGNIHCVFAVGATAVLFQDTINLKKIIQTVIDRKATTFSVVPVTIRLIISNYPEEFKECGRYLRFIQTNMSLLERELIEGVFSVLPNTDFNYYYGLAEASRSTWIKLNKESDKIGSVGRAAPNVELKIINENGEQLPIGEMGEICVKGEHVIEEYWENPEASKKIKDGWLQTGDSGYLDKEGFLYFKSRKDDVINVAGEKVSPEEVEAVVSRVSGVIDAAAVGIPDKLLGEAIKVFVSVKAQDFDTEAIIRECGKHLERYKVPKVVEIIETIPRTENGKLKRGVLKSL